MTFDVAVIGCGVAGLSAAVSAVEAGASVVLLERAPKAERGGNSRYTEAWMRMKDETAVADDFVDRMLAGHGAIGPEMLREVSRDYDNWPPNVKAYPFNDPELVLALAEEAPPAMAWLKSHGVKFTFHSPMLLQKGPERMGPSGGGLAIVEALAQSAERLGIDIRYETTGRALILDDVGTVRGLRCWAPEKGLFVIAANNVVVASGGYQGNLEMMTRYVGANAHLTRPVSPGGVYNKGEGIEMMLAAGAAAAGQYDMFHGEPVDPRSPRHEALIAVVNYGILVNNQGVRFFDEGTNRYEFIYDDISWTIMRQKMGIAHLLFDSRLYEIPNIKTRIKTDQDPIRATSAREMAQKIGVPPASLEATLRKYNAAVREGLYDTAALDGKATEGIVPPKSNWAREINEADLYAFPIMCANTFTCGGVKVNSKAQVVNRDGYPIPGLYAAGETVGLFYNLYVGATSVLRGITLGRIAGRTIASSR
ncbi:FAD-binding dehydrogenase [Methylovirgula ligni]|uniref:Tricarballylate dehydrogenase n=1 Tax=Methylovirgula ligni TaxID=569860 RepID=A0A3D9Z4E1_9HYPH|nr:FAD-dependent oxidoreductase [Methylovirgula ligni]QAY95498.1 FAD-binding dehydrogenase [Methylovirgula ligni]REF89168.1 tricarballylate dehydrogenase [Methylovirgula ligni]